MGTTAIFAGLLSSSELLDRLGQGVVDGLAPMGEVFVLAWSWASCLGASAYDDPLWADVLLLCCFGSDAVVL